jgi:ADP-ribose pyrophosphatase
MDEQARRAGYEALRGAAPEAFVNPPGAPIELLLDPADVAAAERQAAETLAADGLPTEWAGTGVVYHDQYVVLLRDAVRMPSGRLGTYIRTIDAGFGYGVAVLPRHEDDVVLVRHFRHSTRRWHLEIPRGFGTAGATPEEDVRREMREEIGVGPARLAHLGVVHPDTGVQGAAVHLFYAELAEMPRATGTEEGIDEIRLVTPAELARLIRIGEISDGFTMAAYLRAVLRGLLPLQ